MIMKGSRGCSAAVMLVPLAVVAMLLAEGCTYQCDPTSCPDGCCQNNVCWEGQEGSYCGMNGQACVDCQLTSGCAAIGASCRHDSQCCPAGSTDVLQEVCYEGSCCVPSGAECGLDTECCSQACNGLPGPNLQPTCQ